MLTTLLKKIKNFVFQEKISKLQESIAKITNLILGAEYKEAEYIKVMEELDRFLHFNNLQGLQNGK